MHAMSPAFFRPPHRAWVAVLAATGLGAALAPAHAGAGAEDGHLAAFTQRLRAQYPATRIDRVARSALPGLYEVAMGSNIAYVDESGRYFLFGHVWDMQARRDLTADRRADLDRVDLAALPKELALKNVAGNGQREVFVLADPNCHHCRELEATLAAMPDVTVYTYLLPILGPDSYRLAEQVWCSPDKGRAWRDWMTQGKPPPGKPGCNTPLAAIAAAAAALGVNGTPVILGADGRRHAGVMTAQELASFLTSSPDLAQGNAVTAQTVAP
jgi:thiol:disulfide interchange protein DsbC